MGKARQKQRHVGKGIVTAVLVVWSVVILFPMVSAILLSFRSILDIYRYPLGFQGGWHLGNYSVAWQGPEGGVGFSTMLVNSVTAAAVAIGLSMTTGSVAAYAARQFSARGRRWFLRFCVFGIVVPLVLLMIPLYDALDGAGLLNEPAAVGLVYAALALPVTILVLHAFYTDFPEELVDAARVDGATERRVFTNIVLPMSRGPLLTVAVLVLIFVWGEAQLGYILLEDPRSQTLAVGLLGFEGQYLTNYGALFAGLTLAMVPVLALYLVFSKKITGGIALSGAIKG